MTSIHPLHKFKYCPVCGSEQFVVQNEKSKCCNRCGFQYFLNPSGATAAFIFNAQKKLLVLRRKHNPGRGLLDLPGGCADIGECAEEGIKREIKEETNLDVSSLRYLFSIPNQYEYSHFMVPTLDLFFICKVTNTLNIKANDDAESFLWLPIEQIKVEDFAFTSIKKAVLLLKEQPQQYL